MNESTLVPREEMSDLDWLARNVHVWPAGDHQPWCYVYMAHGGVMKAAGNFLDAVAKPTMITIDQWLALRAELQNKPSWETHEYKVIAQGRNGSWYGSNYSEEKFGHESSFCIHGTGWNCICRGVDLGDWRDTLEKRQEQNEFEPFVSIEDSQEKEMKQDNKWFERGELPPVGEVCEILGAFGHYQKWFECKIIAEHNCSVFAANERSWINVRKGQREFRPLRTERERAVDEMMEHCDYLGSRDFAGKLFDAGYRKEVK